MNRIIHFLSTSRTALILLLATLLTATTAQTAWAQDVTYFDENGTEQACSTYTTVTNSSTSWSGGWYVVSSSTTIANRITVSGLVNLILCNGAMLTASKGITVGSDATLNIYAQTDDEATMGALVADATNDNANWYAGIGGVENADAGTITINGGKINAIGFVGAGIGSGGGTSTVGTITINGGIVTAHDNGNYGAGIGGGFNGGKASTINLNGGIINAAGIGSGYIGGDCSITVNISDGIRKIVATPVLGGACIGKGNSASGSVTVNFVSGGNIVTGDDKDAVFHDSGEGSERQIRVKALNHAVTMSDDLKANITLNTEYALEGETITLTLGTAVDASTLKVNDGTSDLTLTDAGNRQYTFTMPAGNVTVTATVLQTYAVNLPANMEVVGATNAADANGKYITGTTVNFKVSFPYAASGVSDGTNTLAATDGVYSVTVADADITVSAIVERSSTIDLTDASGDFTAIDNDVLTGTTSHTVTIADGANITLSGATINGGIVCEGSATITLVGTNSVTGASQKAGIQIGGFGTTLTIKGDGSLTANGGYWSAGIGLSAIFNYDNNVSSGNIIIEGGTITATGSKWGAGIGTGVIKNTNNDNSTSVQFGNVTIKGGTVTATGGDSGDGIGKGYSFYGPAITFGTVTIYDDIDKVDASSIKNSGSIVYKHDETVVTESKSDYFTIIENGNRLIIVQKVTPTIADVPDQTYTGSEITPEPIVQTGSLSLTKGTDYEYSYTNNTNFGTATVRATFQGTYASLGYVERTFTILPPPVVVNVTGNGTVTYNDKSAASGETIGVTAEKGTDVTLTLTPGNGYAVRSVEYGYTNSNEVTMNGAKLPINGTTATLTVPNDLKDGTYVNLTVTFVSALVGGADEVSAVALTDNTLTDLAGGWYKVDSDITFDHTLNLLGDTYLTFAGGKTMTVNTASNRGIYSDYALIVSGDGALSVTTTAGYEIAICVGNYVQTGVTVTASGYIGIRCMDDFIAFNFDNDFTFSGGQLNATGSGGDGIRADNTITLGWTNPADRITASSISTPEGGTVAVADGQTLTDDSGHFYSGTLSAADLAALAGKTLQPCLALADAADNTDAITAHAGKTLAVALSGRTLYKDGSWNTLCLPFSVATLDGTPLEGATIKELDAANSNLADDGTLTLKFKDATSIEAGKPYIVKWETAGENISNPVFEGVTITATAPVAVEFTNNATTGGDCRFVGQFSPFTIDDSNLNEIILMGAGSKLGYSKAARTLKCFRAHFYVPANDGAGARSFVLDFDDGMATSLSEELRVKSEKFATATGWYTLDGHKLNGRPTAKGVYIVNGKKVVIK
ncbi:MAG: hypothetical protein J6M01_02915 [Prevotella sp.]|nr:hypothetical protein [Prevotella sp.]